MKFTEAAIDLQPRSIGACLDLATMFVSRRLSLWLATWAIFTIPTCGLVYLIAETTDYGFLGFLAGLGFGSVPLGTALVFAAAQTAMGQSCTAGQAAVGGLRVSWKPMLTVAALRVIQLPLLLAVLPGLALAILTGFHAEARVFARWRAGEHEHKVGELIHSEYSDLMVRGGALIFFGAGCWWLLTLTVDCASTVLFGLSPIITRFGDATRNIWELDDWSGWWSAAGTFMTSDSLTLTTLTATGLAAYAVCRLAWFFAYIDLRIRRDCWDLELALAEEAEKAEGRG